MKFIPHTTLLNNIYVPFYEKPSKEDKLTLKSFPIEADNNGVLSTINMSTPTKRYQPFFDNNKFDFERRDWFWYNKDGFPFRFTYDSNNSEWVVESIYGVPNINAVTPDISLLFDRNLEFELGLYTTVRDTTMPENPTTVSLYKGIPIIVAIQGVPLIDITDYSTPTIQPTLTTTNSIINKEFYYDPIQNKIFTNQNLAGVDSADIIVGFYTTISDVNIKCRMATNTGTQSFITPVVDYYIAKLSGQSLRG